MILMSFCLGRDSGMSLKLLHSSSSPNARLQSHTVLYFSVSSNVIALSSYICSLKRGHTSLIRRKEKSNVNDLKIHHESHSIASFSQNSRVPLNSAITSQKWPLAHAPAALDRDNWL